MNWPVPTACASVLMASVSTVDSTRSSECSTSTDRAVTVSRDIPVSDSLRAGLSCLSCLLCLLSLSLTVSHSLSVSSFVHFCLINFFLCLLLSTSHSVSPSLHFICVFFLTLTHSPLTHTHTYTHACTLTHSHTPQSLTISLSCLLASFRPNFICHLRHSPSLPNMILLSLHFPASPSAHQTCQVLFDDAKCCVMMSGVV